MFICVLWLTTNPIFSWAFGVTSIVLCQQEKGTDAL